MKIEDKTKGTTTHIVDVRLGEIFRYNSSIFIKTDEVRNGGWLCVNLETGEMYNLYSDYAVEVVQGTLTITP